MSYDRSARVGSRLPSHEHMKTCEYHGVPFEHARSHPWTDATGNPNFRYYDLTAAPEQHHAPGALECFGDRGLVVGLRAGERTVKEIIS